MWDKQKELRVLFISSAAVLLFSFLIGSWTGMGIGVIMAYLVVLVFVKIIKRNTL